jgi:hypothetical protein
MVRSFLLQIAKIFQAQALSQLLPAKGGHYDHHLLFVKTVQRGFSRNFLTLFLEVRDARDCSGRRQ